MPIPSGVPDYSDLMNRFRRAYAKADPALLAGVLADGFQWHNHWFQADDPNTTGRVLHGIDDTMTELLYRKQHWSDVRFDALVEHFAPGLVTQSFTISGVDQGVPFANAAVDLYTVTDDEKIVKKDTYWKFAATRTP
jgi:hypothetical protein